MKNNFITLFFIALSCAIAYFFTSKLSDNQFLYMGDQALRMDLSETVQNAFYLRRPVNLGTPNAWEFVTQFFDQLYFLVYYSMGFTSVLIAERVLFFIVLLYSFIFGYAGFTRLNRLLKVGASKLAVLAITCWYVFNPYTLSLWHGGIYNITLGLTYSLAPLSLYYVHVSVFKDYSLRTSVIAGLILVLQTFVFWLFAPYAIFLVLYTILFAVLTKTNARLVLKRMAIIALSYVPLASVIIFPILFEYFNSQGVSNAQFSPPFGNQMGGLRYQFLMLFSWGIYNIWTPRAMYPFHSHFFSRGYINSTLLVYGLILCAALIPFLRTSEPWKFIKLNFQKKFIITIVAIYSVSLFFSKGAQAPLGTIFLFFYEHVPFFSVFRTPDLRFGFTIVLSVALLLLIASKFYQKYLFALIIVVIIFFQVRPFWNGEALYGANIETNFYDRVVTLPKEYKEVIEFFNSGNGDAYILPLPPHENGHYTLPPDDIYIGQDILSKKITLPFIFLSQSTGIYDATYQSLTKIIQTRKVQSFKDYPIEYVLLRNDVRCEKCRFVRDTDLSALYPRVFKNALFTVYKISGLPLIHGEDVSFRQINPMKFEVTILDATHNKTVRFLQSYNTHWKIYDESPSDNELGYVWKKPISEESHTQFARYANEWTIKPTHGEEQRVLTLYYKPQSWYWLSLIISGSALLLASGYVLISKTRSRKKIDESSRRKVNMVTDTEPSHNHVLTYAMAKRNFIGKTVLDIGCWTGQYEKLAVHDAKKIIGIDPGKEAIATARTIFRSKKNVQFQVGHAEKLEFPRNSFDTVLYSEVIEHIPKGTELTSLTEAYRVLRKGGTLILTTPNSTLQAILLDPAYFIIGHRHYSVEHITRMVQSVGFSVSEIKIVGGVYNSCAILAESIWKHLRLGTFVYPSWLNKKIKEEWNNGFMRVYVVAKK